MREAAEQRHGEGQGGTSASRQWPLEFQPKKRIRIATDRGSTGGVRHTPLQGGGVAPIRLLGLTDCRWDSLNARNRHHPNKYEYFVRDELDPARVTYIPGKL